MVRISMAARMPTARELTGCGARNFCVPRYTLNVERSTFNVQRTLFNVFAVRCSMFDVRRRYLMFTVQ